MIKMLFLYIAIGIVRAYLAGITPDRKWLFIITVLFWLPLWFFKRLVK